MKIVKLDRRHRLFRKGMVYAFKFNNDWGIRTHVENILRGIYGWEYTSQDWNTFRGKVIIKKTPDGFTDRTYTYWIGVRNEADITAVMLQIE